jgi:hypothetical protein
MEANEASYALDCVNCEWQDAITAGPPIGAKITQEYSRLFAVMDTASRRIVGATFFGAGGSHVAVR